MLRDYEQNLRKEAVEKLYIAGYVANSPCYGDEYLLGEYQLERHASEDFEDNYRALEEFIREDVRDEEMEIARRDIPDLERQVESLEKEVQRVREEKELRTVKELQTILANYEVEEPVTNDAEQWAYNDGVNSVINKLKARLEAYGKSI